MPASRSQRTYNNPSRARRGGGGGGGSRGGNQRGGQRGGQRGRGGRSGRGGRAGSGSGYTPYTCPTFSTQEKAYFYRSSTPDMDTKLAQPGLKAITFGADFEIRDEHILAIANNTPLATALNSLSLGDSDTGNGFHLSDAAVQTLICAAPNLRVLSLDACTKLTDATLLMALDRCPRLELLRLTGNDKVKGSLTAKCLKDIKTQTSLAPALKELVLYD
ncbi:hypothetical protein DFH09DRAFT_456838 [Mycena vulgaris]|nr:hypothetical protein DFH09DRAFT_456838 [Mycena vulgaris]